jgi:homoserine kinase
VIPPHRLPTAEARSSLGEEVPRLDAVFNVGHAALLVEGLTRDPALLPVALRDRMHERERLAMVPEVEERFGILADARIPVCVSGAGPTLLAFPPLEGPEVTHALLDVPATWRIVPIEPSSEGFGIDEPHPPGPPVD